MCFPSQCHTIDDRFSIGRAINSIVKKEEKKKKKKLLRDDFVVQAADKLRNKTAMTTYVRT